MDAQAIFGLQFLLSLIVWALIAKWLLIPWLAQKPPQDRLFWLVLPHAFRHMGMVFLVPGLVAQRLPDNFAIPAAYGRFSDRRTRLISAHCTTGSLGGSIGAGLGI